MDTTTAILIILGLALFETVSSVDNAIINADVLRTMSPKYRKWFLFYGIIMGVFIVRGLLPWMIVWATNSEMGAMGALKASFSSDPGVIEAIEASTPVLLIAGGTYLIFLFLHWWFIEPKQYGFIGEKSIEKFGLWFFCSSFCFVG